MRITNPTPINSAETTPTPTPRADSTASGVSTNPVSSPSAASAPPDAYTLVPSFELQSLNALLQQVPPVRADVIAATVQRLASGQLRTANAIEQTARALLGI